MTSPLQQQKEMLGHLIIVCRTSTESIFQMVRFYFCVRLSRPSALKCKRKLLFSHASVCVIRTKKTKKKIKTLPPRWRLRWRRGSGRPEGGGGGPDRRGASGGRSTRR